jgi:hypothetical protein
MREQQLRGRDWPRSDEHVELVPDTYLTDGKGLFRCVSIDGSAAAGATVLLEDCMTLEVVRWTLSELATANVSLVR